MYGFLFIIPLFQAWKDAGPVLRLLLVIIFLLSGFVMKIKKRCQFVFFRQSFCFLLLHEISINKKMCFITKPTCVVCLFFWIRAGKII